MGALKKVGLPFKVKVDTKNDLYGAESGFRVSYIKDSDGTITDVNATFSEVVKNVDVFSTTLASNVNSGDRVIPLNDVTGLNIGDVLKIETEYVYVKSIDTNNKTVTIRKGLKGAHNSGVSVDRVGNTGIYIGEVTINEAGDFTLVVSNPTFGMDNVSFPVTLEHATIDDVKDILDDIKPEVDTILQKVESIEIDEINNLHEELSKVEDTLQTVKEMITDVTATVKISGDVTSNLSNGDEIVGESSGAFGFVSTATYDSTADVTTLVLSNVKGTFDDETPENLINKTKETTIGAISGSVTYGGGAVDSVLEFLKQLKESVNGTTGLDQIITYEKDIMHLINGDETLEDGSACPTAGKGLVAIFDEISNTHSEVTAIKNLAEDANNGFVAIRQAIDNSKQAIIEKINSLLDENDANSLISKINAIKSVVDSNNTILSDSNYGLEAIKTLIDSDYAEIIARFDTIDSNFTNLQNHIDGKFDEVLTRLNDIKEGQTFNVFA